MCGWLKDKFGVSWQVTPVLFNELSADYESDAYKRMETAMFSMKKLDIKTLMDAYNG
jgi:predicted 3-demethylubiquinone-9 3-methyltransferase (glyoxalase superfamily)